MTTPSPKKKLNLFRYIGYVCATPFLVLTYLAWCGPIHWIHHTTQALISLSFIFLLGFSTYCYLSLDRVSRRKKYLVSISVMLIGIPLLFALNGIEQIIAHILLTLSHIALWGIEVFKIKHSEQHIQQRTAFSLILICCHILTATQYLPS